MREEIDFTEWISGKDRKIKTPFTKENNQKYDNNIQDEILEDK